MLAADWTALLSACRPRLNCLLPGEDEADVAGYAARILEHLGLEVEAEWSQVIVPEFVSSFGPAFQRRFPTGLRVVDPSAAIAAQHVGKAVDLNFTLSALGRPTNQLHDALHDLFGRPFRRFVKFRHYLLLLFLLLFHMTHFFSGLRCLALGHPTPEIRGGESACSRRRRRAAIVGHDFLRSYRISFPPARGHGGRSSGFRRSLSHRLRYGYQVC